MNDSPDMEPERQARRGGEESGEEVNIPLQPDNRASADASEESAEIPPREEGTAPADEAATEARPPQEEGAEAVDVSQLSEDDIRKLVQEAEERDLFYDKFLRAKAELVNYQKRVRRDLEMAGDIAVMDLVRKMLPVLDNFDRALESAGNHKKFKAFHKGITLIEQQLYKALEEGGIKRIQAVGKPFDPNYHEAVTMEKNEDQPDGTVLEEFQKGYAYKGKIVRPAKVKISTKTSKE